MITLKCGIDVMDWQSLTNLFTSVGWTNLEPEKLKRAYENSYLVCFAFDENRLIGTARAISDGEYYSAIYDVVVTPEYQGKGIGKQMMNYLKENLFPLQMLLVSVPGKDEFYKKLQFRKNKTAMTLYQNPDKAEASGFIE